MDSNTTTHEHLAIEPGQVQRLRSQLQGQVFLPEDDGYEEARQSWAPEFTFSQHPAIIILPITTADVVVAVKFAREQGLLVAVQNGGHGHILPADQNALLINFRCMTKMQINPEASTARVEPGLTWGTVVEQAQNSGLAPLNGFNPTVGVVGYLLGGGLGWFVRQYGLAASSIRSAEVVTADGRVLHVSEEHHADLLWGLRGGDGNFGIVTEIEFSLYPVNMVFGGHVYYPIEQGREAMKAFLEWVRTVPIELTSDVRLMHVPPVPQFPPAIRGQSVVQLSACYNGSAEEGEKWLRPMRTFGTPLQDTFALMPYSQVATIAGEPEESPPVYYYVSNKAVKNLTARDIDLAFDLAANPASGITVYEIRHLGGVLTEIPESAMALSMPDVNFAVLTFVFAPERSLLKKAAESTAALMNALKADASIEALLNFLSFNDVGPERTRAAYTPANYQRLAALKNTYDPHNIFRYNHNIPPSQQED